MTRITIIAALAANGAIGLGNRLLYRMPNDMKRFKALTTGHTVVMGRKTFESLPKGALPDRRNIVLSRRPGASFPGAECYASLQEALTHCGTDEAIYIIGGASVYAEAMPLADRLCLTHIDDTPPEADAFFPDIDPDEWQAVAEEVHPADEKHAHAYRFTDYERR